jgi:hypothetical protein
VARHPTPSNLISPLACGVHKYCVRHAGGKRVCAVCVCTVCRSAGAGWPQQHTVLQCTIVVTFHGRSE